MFNELPELRKIKKASNHDSTSFSKHAKAISPILATLLIIVITVAGAVVTFVWFQNFSENQLTNASGFVVIENVNFGDTSQIEATIRNTGTGSVTLQTIYLNDVRYDVTQTVKAHEAATIAIDYSWASGEKCKLKVVSGSGLFAEGSYSAPCKDLAWYDQSWSKRKTVAIDNTLNADDLANYQVKVDVAYDSDMKTDFSDLRFTDADGQTLVSYWIESYTASEHGVVWVKVPHVSASSTKTIYMYYGNPSAASESNPDNTFDVFVDFTRDGVATYGVSQDADSTQWEIIEDSTLRMWGNNWKATMRNLAVTGDGSQAICFDYKSVGAQSEINGVGLDTDNNISPEWFYRVYGSQNWGLNDHYGYTGAGDWQSYALILDNFSGDFNRFVFSNDADAGQATNIYYRNVRVSQYVATAPTVSLGAEEAY